MAEPIDTTNKFLISIQGDSIVALRPLPQRLSQSDALLLAAYLVSMAIDKRSEWEPTLAAVENS